MNMQLNDSNWALGQAYNALKVTVEMSERIPAAQFKLKVGAAALTKEVLCWCWAHARSLGASTWQVRRWPERKHPWLTFVVAKDLVSRRCVRCQNQYKVILIVNEGRDLPRQVASVEVKFHNGNVQLAAWFREVLLEHLLFMPVFFF